MPEIHKGKRRRKTRIWLADLYFLDVLLQATGTSLGLKLRIALI